MTCIAIIPARGGSKGIPNKNLAEVNGQSLVSRAIKSAVRSGVVDFVVVSSDDRSILDAATAAGAIAIPRPTDLATDTAAIEDAVSHALRKFLEDNQAPTTLVLLQPTSPLRQSSTISDAVQLFIENGSEGSVYGVIETEHHPFKAFTTTDGTLHPVGTINDLSRSRQELPKAYRQSGSIYVVGVQDFLTNNSLFISPVRWIEVSSEEAIDVDTPADLEAVRQAARNSNA
jgi:N-acylneuraminate cytidylyltransferase